MTALLRPVTKMKCSMPASRASSTTYWMTGRSTTVSISFGMALVAGRNRVPRPATGKTALRTRFMLTPLRFDHYPLGDALRNPPRDFHAEFHFHAGIHFHAGMLD